MKEASDNLIKKVNNNLLTIKLLRHKDTSEEVIDKIVFIKQQHWQYSKDQQLDWIVKNIGDDDIHLMIYSQNNSLIAYMNLVNVKTIVGDERDNVFGIGNVCVDNAYLGKSLGLLLMNACTFYLKDAGVRGVLLCKDKLVPFYTKTGWRQYRHTTLIKREKYIGNVFFSDDSFDSAKEVILDKTF